MVLWRAIQAYVLRENIDTQRFLQINFFTRMISYYKVYLLTSQKNSCF